MKRVLLFALIIAACAFAEETCLDLCSSCMSESKPDACSKVETLCKCSSLVENLRQELQSNDSVVAESPAVDSSTVDSSAVDSSVVETAVVGSSAVDTAVTDSSVVDSSVVAKTAADTSVTDTAKNTVAESDSVPKENEVFYMGVSLGYESYHEARVAGIPVEDDSQWGLNLGFLLRWYLYRWGSFQTGVNVVYHQAEYDASDWDVDDYDVDYKSIMVELPLQVRLGMPLGKTPISPFVSLNVYVRKPVYAWVDYYAAREHQSIIELGGGYYQNTVPITEYLVDDSADGFYKTEDWEFLEYAGIGVEVNRYVSLQWQFLLFSTVTYSDTRYYSNYLDIFDEKITWRAILDIVW